jgi:hypothetical protein
MDEGDTPYEGLFCTCGLKACDAAWQAGKNKGCPECQAPWPASLGQRYPYSGKPEVRSYNPSPVEQLAAGTPVDDGTKVLAGHRVRVQSPAHRAAVKLLEEQDRVKGAERFERDAYLVRRRAEDDRNKALKELLASEGYLRRVEKV